MKLTGRLGVRIAIAISVMVFAVLIALRAVSGLGNVAAMAPLGGERGVLISAFGLGYCEITYVTRWPAPRFGFWAGEDWRDMGPYLSWAFSRDHTLAKLGYREGVAMVPLVSPGGPVEYEDGYLRAEALGYPNRLARPPFTVVVNAWRIQFPDGAIVLLAAAFPAAWILSGFWAARKRSLRRRAGHCIYCGYDLCASSGSCPECGVAPAVHAIPQVRPFSRRLSRLADVSLCLCIAVSVAWLATFHVGVVRQHSQGSLVGNVLHGDTIQYGFTRAGIWRVKTSGLNALSHELTSVEQKAMDSYLAPAGVWETQWNRGRELNREPDMGLLGDISLQSYRTAGWRSFEVGVRMYLVIAVFAILPVMRWWRKRTINVIESKTSQTR